MGASSVLPLFLLAAAGPQVATSSVVRTSTATAPVKTTTVAAPRPPPLMVVDLTLGATVTASRTTVYGRVFERGTRRPLEDAEVEVAGDLVLTDRRGRFQLLNVPTGEQIITATAHLHERQSTPVTVHPGQAHELVFWLERERFDPYEVVVRGRQKPNTVSQHSLDVEEVATAAGTLGDPIKAVQNLPGTSRTAYGLGGLVVRGSPPADTKVYFDGHEIPALFHFGGLTSVVNADSLSRIDFSPGNFSVRYGRGTGGVVELEPRAGKAAPHGYFDLDLLDVTFLAEAEVGGGGLLVSGRRSWVDTFFNLIFAGIGNDLEVAPRTYDYQLRYEHALFGGQAGVMVFGADDAFQYVVGDDQNRDRPTFRFDNSFHQLQAYWRGELGDGWRARLTASTGLSTDAITVGDAFTSDLDRFDTRLRAELGKKWTSLQVEGGLDLELTDFTFIGVGPPPRGPGAVVVRPNPVPDLTTGELFDDGGNAADNVRSESTDLYAAPALWLEGRWDPLESLRFIPGVRADYHSLMGRATIDPRLGVAVRITDDVSLTGGVGLFHAPPPLAYFSERFGSPELLPERAIHASLGARVELPWALTLTGELYDKELSDLAVPAAAPEEGDPVFVSDGVGRAFGLELMLRRRLGQHLSGWISYSLSRSVRTPEEGREEQLFSFDQTHVLTVLLSYRTDTDWTFSTRVRYASGNPYIPVVGSVFFTDRGDFAPIFDAEPSERLPGFFQIDVRVDKEWVFDEVIATAYIDIQNVTNHNNAEGWQYNFDYSRREALRGLPILPTAGLRLQF